MSVVVEGRRAVHLAGAAHLVEENRELAWAEAFVRKAPDVKWILGNYVQASTPDHPTYNSNGHEFPYEDLKDSIKNIPNRPLNLLHAPGRRVGTFAAAEFVYPMDAEGASEDGSQPPIVEALAAYWAYYEPELLASIEMAHRQGALFFSMEAVPKEVTCKGKGEFAGCGQTFAYDGRQSPTYCDHLNEIASRKTLHKPMFTAGALIIPPVKPGWKNADIKEISHLIEENILEAEIAYDQISAEFSHLSPPEWERMMAWFLAATQEG